MIASNVTTCGDDGLLCGREGRSFIDQPEARNISPTICTAITLTMVIDGKIIA
jgi:hypothetical protein